MNQERKLELISKIERAFPVIAQILRQRSRESLRDRPANGASAPESERRRRKRLRLIRKNTRRLRAQRVALGLCRDCGDQRCQASRLFCAAHLERRRQYARKSEKKRARERRSISVANDQRRTTRFRG